MKYDKPALTYVDQAELLIKRGLIADRSALITRLQSVNYYRLSGYLYPYRLQDNTFRPGTTFDAVWRHYAFDRRLRLLVLDAIERFEVALRTQVVYEHVHRYGPFGYTTPENLPKLTGDHFGNFLSRIYTETKRSREIFVGHFREKYGNAHPYLPLWMVAEVVSFGLTFTFFTGVEPNIKRVVARYFGVPDEVLFSWLRALHVVRNICAHHGRLWNRELGVRPLFPYKRKYPEWHEPVNIPNHRIFGVLTILKYLLGVVAPQSLWPKRLHCLLEEYPEVSRISMGFPANWDDCPIWRDSV